MKKIIIITFLIYVFLLCQTSCKNHTPELSNENSFIDSISTKSNESVPLNNNNNNNFDTINNTQITYLIDVKICNQIWAIKNLDVSTYRNGDPIPKITDNDEWLALRTGAYCYYNNDSVTYAAIYGKLYNGYAVTDPRGLAPEGWHIPSNIEWQTLITCLGGSAVAGEKMKESGKAHWAYNTISTNSSGWTGLPGGHRSPNYGQFDNIEIKGHWWSSNVNNKTGELGFRTLLYDENYIGARGTSNENDQSFGFSVRCLRDSIAPQ